MFDRLPPARFATRRDPAYQTEGAEVARTAKLMGIELMPWQRYVIDVASEYTIFGPGESQQDRFLGQRRYRYSKIVVTVPRQSGKTTLLSPVKVHRLLTRPKLAAFSTAQTGADAGKRMAALIEQVVTSPISPLFKPRHSTGSSGLKCLGNASTLTQFAPLPSSIHGDTPALVDYDEFWKFSKELGDALVGAVSPAMVTLLGRAQTWFVSTMGTAASGFMNEMVAEGRAGNDPSMAYFEWSMPDGLDPYDPDTWWTFHPALGNTIGADALLADIRIPYSEWMRGYMNRLVEATDVLIPGEDWDTLGDDFPEGAPAWSEIAVAYEVAHGGDAAAIYGVWRDANGNPCAHVIHAAAGTHWVPDLLREIDRLGPLVVASDDGGDTRVINDIMSQEGMDIYHTGMRDFGTACMGYLTAARDDRTLRHDRSTTLRHAMLHTALRGGSGDGWRFSRKHSTGPIAAVIAVAVGLWAYDHKPAAMPAPYIYTGSDD